jgi:hypothetical protein
MARIALFDARARRRLGAGAGVAALNTTLAQLGHELLRGKEAPWMHERFGCDGQQQLNRTYALAPLPSAAELDRSVVSSTLGSERRVEHTWLGASCRAHLDRSVVSSTLGSERRVEHTWVGASC